MPLHRLGRQDAFFNSPSPMLMLAKDRGFPCDNPLGILKWRYANSDEDKAPLKVTCWPSDQRGKTHCNLEYELGEVIPELQVRTPRRAPAPMACAHPALCMLQDIVISIPVPSQPEVRHRPTHSMGCALDLAQQLPCDFACTRRSWMSLARPNTTPATACSCGS